MTGISQERIDVAEHKYQNDMRVALSTLQTFALNAESKLQTFARDADSRMQTWMRDSETKRIDQLAGQRDRYDDRIAIMLSEATKDKSLLVSGQLVQIQATFDARVNKLEEYRLLSTGRSSVADPALANALTTLGNKIESLQTGFTKAMSDITDKQSEAMAKMSLSIVALQSTNNAGEAKGAGRHEVIAWIVAGGMFLVTVATPILMRVIH